MTDIDQASRAFLRAALRLPTLYELSDEYTTLLDLLEDEDAEPAAVEAELDRVAGDITKKAYGVAAVIRQLDGLAELQKVESKRLADKARASEAKASRLREYAKRCMQAIGTEKIETGTFTLAIRTNPPKVEVLDASLIPSEYQRTKIEVTVDKKAIGDHFKTTGEIVTGAEIVRSQRLDIR